MGNLRGQRRWFKLGQLILGIAMLFQVAGCATGGGAAQREIFWPPPPYEARIQWLSSIRYAQDAGISKGFWKKVAEFITGEEASGIVKPYGVYADPDGRLFVADVALGAIHIFDLKGKTYTQIGELEKPFRSPIALTGDGEGNLYVTDSSLGAVFRYNLREKTMVSFIVGKLARPTGIAFNRTNRLLYVTDTGSHQVAVFDLKGVERFRIGERGETQGSFNYPTDLFIDNSGSLYVTDPLNGRIQVFSAAGKLLGVIGSKGDTAGYFDKPKGVAVDSEGHIYVADAMQHMVQIFDREGKLLLDFGEPGTGRGQFLIPSGMFIDGGDTIYVADAYNQRVQLFRYLKAAERKPGQPGAKLPGITIPTPGQRPAVTKSEEVR